MKEVLQSSIPLIIDEGGFLVLKNPLLIDEGGFSVMLYHQPCDSAIFPFTVLSGFECDRKSLMKKKLYALWLHPRLKITLRSSYLLMWSQKLSSEMLVCFCP